VGPSAQIVTGNYPVKLFHSDSSWADYQDYRRCRCGARDTFRGVRSILRVERIASDRGCSSFRCCRAGWEWGWAVWLIEFSGR